MGTNYYVKAPKPCDDCGEEHICKQAIHIGKSSYGWQFLFAYNGGTFYKSYGEFEEWLADKEIYDEYNQPITQKDFFNMIESKMDGRADSDHCIVIDGYRFMDGEFS